MLGGVEYRSWNADLALWDHVFTFYLRRWAIFPGHKHFLSLYKVSAFPHAIPSSFAKATRQLIRPSPKAPKRLPCHADAPVFLYTNTTFTFSVPSTQSHCQHPSTSPSKISQPPTLCPPSSLPPFPRPCNLRIQPAQMVINRVLLPRLRSRLVHARPQRLLKLDTPF